MSCFGAMMRLYWGTKVSQRLTIYPAEEDYTEQDQETLLDGYLENAWDINISTSEGRTRLNEIKHSIHEGLQDIIQDTQRTIEWEKQQK